MQHLELVKPQNTTIFAKKSEEKEEDLIQTLLQQKPTRQKRKRQNSIKTQKTENLNRITLNTTNTNEY